MVAWCELFARLNVVLWKMYLFPNIMSGLVEDLCVMNVGNCGPICVACPLSSKLINNSPLVFLSLCRKNRCLELMSPIMHTGSCFVGALQKSG